MKWMEKLSDESYALLRILAGFMFMFHGAQKILGVLSTFQPPMGSQLWCGGLIELIAGAAIMIGFKTRWAAFLCSGTMAVAYVQFHWKLEMGKKFFPAINEGELALLYSLVFLVIACRGTVKWGLDKKA
jgi:putative oxidoreductase